MKLKLYKIDAFTNKVFGGNPAAVCPLESWISDEVMQNIAMENNLAETVFYVKNHDYYEIRWFTPLVEVDLCGHATLAAAYVLFHHEGYAENLIQFHSHRSGSLSVKKEANLLTLNFPTDVFNDKINNINQLAEGFNIKPIAIYKGKTDYLFIYNTEADIKNLTLDFDKIAKLDCRGVIVTAKGDEVDFVSRFFAPQCGVNEDPVTGSAHTTLTPYWAKKLNKNTLTAVQLSHRKGYLTCTYLNDRVAISGEGKLYLIGEIFIN
jgi:PhzF family phenazine biosynthesis protein